LNINEKDLSRGMVINEQLLTGIAIRGRGSHGGWLVKKGYHVKNRIQMGEGITRLRRPIISGQEIVSSEDLGEEKEPREKLSRPRGRKAEHES